MKKTLFSALLAAAVLLCGCNNTESPSEPHSDNSLPVTDSSEPASSDVSSAESTEPVASDTTPAESSCPEPSEADNGFHLTGLFGEEIDKSFITQVLGPDDTPPTPDELTADNWYYITCEGFAYAAEPSAECYTSVDNSDIWNAEEFRFDGVDEVAPTEYQRVVPGDTVCGMTVKSAAARFRSELVQNGCSPDIPGIYFSGCEVEFEGTVEMTGYVCIAPEDDYGINAGDITFVPAPGNGKLPVVKFNRTERNEIVNRMIMGGTNDFYWYNEYPGIHLGNTSELGFDVTGIPAEWAYHKAKIVVDGVKATCDIDWIPRVECGLVSLKAL